MSWNLGQRNIYHYHTWHLSLFPTGTLFNSRIPLYMCVPIFWNLYLDKTLSGWFCTPSCRRLSCRRLSSTISCTKPNRQICTLHWRISWPHKLGSTYCLLRWNHVAKPLLLHTMQMIWTQILKEKHFFNHGVVFFQVQVLNFVFLANLIQML